MTRTRSTRLLADSLIVAIAFVWGSTFVVVKAALNDAPTMVFLAARLALAAVLLLLLFRRNLSAFRPGPALAAGAITGSVLLVGYALQTAGLRYTTASKSAFLTGLCIVMVPVFAAVFERQFPRLAEALGVAVATGGMALMTLRRDSFTLETGDLLTIACAVAYAVHILLVGYFVEKVGFEALTLVQLATAAVLATASCWWTRPIEVRWTPGLLWAIGITGVLATAFAFAAQAWAQQHTTPTRTALILALEPIFAWLTSYVVAGELLSRQATLGAILILAGVLLVELKPNANRRDAEDAEAAQRKT